MPPTDILGHLQSAESDLYSTAGPGRAGFVSVALSRIASQLASEVDRAMLSSVSKNGRHNDCCHAQPNMCIHVSQVVCCPQVCFGSIGSLVGTGVGLVVPW